MRQVTSSMHMLLSVQDTPGRSYPSYITSKIKVFPHMYACVLESFHVYLRVFMCTYTHKLSLSHTHSLSSTRMYACVCS
jgi:hypothetical protein